MSRCPVCGLDGGFHQDDSNLVPQEGGRYYKWYRGHRLARQKIPANLVRRKEKP